MSRTFTDNTGSFNVSNTYNNNVITVTAADDESQIRAWLSPLEPQLRHHDIFNLRVDSIGDWLLETKEFISWYEGSGHAVLFCYGNPGVGKSYIWYEQPAVRNKKRVLSLTGGDAIYSSVVVDYLCNHAIDQGVAVACFYYDFASREAQSPTNMLGSLLSQLLSGQEAIPEAIRNEFMGQKKLLGGRRVRFQDIVKMFPAVSSLRRTFICIDALDECIPEHQVEVLGALGQILQRSPKTRIFMTGRSHVRGVVERELGGGAISVSIKPRDGDIVTYLRARLRKDTTPEVMDSGLENDIMKIIPEEVSETYVVMRGLGSLCRSCTNRRKSRFLLISLRIDEILRGTTIHRRREKLEAMGDGLGLEGAYQATLVRVRAQEGEKVTLAMTALMWICYSERPLLVDELCHALAVEIGCMNFNSDNAPAAETLLACCQGLVTVDKEASTFRLIHHTLREYLCTHQNLFPRADSLMAETCLTYLNSDKAGALSANPQPDLLSSMPFLKYCSRYWGTHAKRELSERTILLAMELLKNYESHVAANTLFEQIFDGGDSREVNAPSQFSGLHCASFFGIGELMSSLFGMTNCDAGQRDFAGMTPLLWAAEGGYGEAVELLLGHCAIDINLVDNEGDTALSWAAMRGHWLVVKQLLDREDIDPDKSNKEGATPLSWAASNGHESVVKQLLERRDVNPDKPDNEGNTPLACAASNGHVSVVQQLLDRGDVNPDKPDNEGSTPLSWAAGNGHKAVVKQLLDQGDVNPDRPNNKGRTPLLCAAGYGHESVVKQLLDRGDVNPDKPDNEGSTPLLCAAGRGRESVVEQLLARGDVNLDKQDNKGRTPLLWAASKGHESVVKQLLDRGNVNPDRPDNEGSTPLLCAAGRGHESVVKQLLDRGDVNPDKQDSKGRTPLLWASSKGYRPVVKQFLDRRDVSPDKPDNEGSTPLSCAASRGHESVVKLLLARGDGNPDTQDNKGRTPLLWAASKGYESVVKQLLDRGNVNPDKPDYEGGTPLSWAANNGHESVVKQLLDRGDVNPDKSDNEGWTPLLCAASYGHQSVVKQLLDRGDVNPDKPDNAGRTPLSCAANFGHQSVVKQLLDRGDVNPNKRDNEGRAPLWWATSNGHELVVKQLSDREDINPGKSDNPGITTITDAGAGGHERVVRQPLDQASSPDRPDNELRVPPSSIPVSGYEPIANQLPDLGVNSNSQGSEGNTPLSASVIGGHKPVLNPSARETPPPPQTIKTRPHFRWLRFEGTKQWLRKAWTQKRPNRTNKAPREGLLSRGLFRRGAK